MAAFITNAEMLERYDARILGQLLSDDDDAVSEPSLLTDTYLTQALEDASGEVLSAANRGGRYSEDDLAALTGNHKAYLQRLVADIAFGYLLQRRGKAVDAYPSVEKAGEALELIEEGERVFGVSKVIEAGVAKLHTPDRITIQEQKFWRDDVRYFPSRRYKN